MKQVLQQALVLLRPIRTDLDTHDSDAVATVGYVFTAIRQGLQRLLIGCDTDKHLAELPRLEDLPLIDINGAVTTT